MKKIYFYHGNGTGNGKIGVFTLENENNITTDENIEAIKKMI